jgi:hypothetical protein
MPSLPKRNRLDDNPNSIINASKKITNITLNNMKNLTADANMQTASITDTDQSIDDNILTLKKEMYTELIATVNKIRQSFGFRAQQGEEIVGGRKKKMKGGVESEEQKLIREQRRIEREKNKEKIEEENKKRSERLEKSKEKVKNIRQSPQYKGQRSDSNEEKSGELSKKDIDRMQKEILTTYEQTRTNENLISDETRQMMTEYLLRMGDENRYSDADIYNKIQSLKRKINKTNENISSEESEQVLIDELIQSYDQQRSKTTITEKTRRIFEKLMKVAGNDEALILDNNQVIQVIQNLKGNDFDQGQIVEEKDDDLDEGNQPQDQYDDQPQDLFETPRNVQPINRALFQPGSQSPSPISVRFDDKTMSASLLIQLNSQIQRINFFVTSKIKPVYRSLSPVQQEFFQNLTLFFDSFYKNVFQTEESVASRNGQISTTLEQLISNSIDNGRSLLDIIKKSSDKLVTDLKLTLGNSRGDLQSGQKTVPMDAKNFTYMGSGRNFLGQTINQTMDIPTIRSSYQNNPTKYLL